MINTAKKIRAEEGDRESVTLDMVATEGPSGEYLNTDLREPCEYQGNAWQAGRRVNAESWGGMCFVWQVDLFIEQSELRER